MFPSRSSLPSISPFWPNTYASTFNIVEEVTPAIREVESNLLPPIFV